MPDLETQLRRYGAHLDKRFPDVTLDEIRGQPRRRTRPDRRRGLRVAVAAALTVGVVGVGLLVWDLLVDLDMPAPVITPVPDDPVDDRTPPGDEEPAGLQVEAPGLILAGGNGVWLLRFDAPEDAVLLPFDGYGIAWAMSDRRGGLIFQHNTTPDAWPPGAILWLRAGAVEPEVLVPPARGWEPSGPSGGVYPIAGLWPFGVATSSDGHAMFVYTADTGASPPNTQALVMAADLDDGGAIRQLATLEPRPGLFDDRPWLLVGGDTVAVVQQPGPDEGCDVITKLLRVDDGAELPATSDCLPGGQFGTRARSHDGRALAAIGPPDLSVSTLPGPHTVDVIDPATGVTLEERTFDLESARSGDLGLLASPDGWSVYHETRPDFVLVDLDGNIRTRVDRTLAPGAWQPRTAFWVGYRNTHFYSEPVELTGGASLGPPPDQGPPVDEPDEDPVALASAADPPDRVEPAEWPLGVVLANADGVLIVPFDDPNEARLLESGDAGIAWVMPDTLGGLIFQHTLTPQPCGFRRPQPCWPGGAVLWLPAGATEPQVLVDVAGRGAYPNGDLWPVGVATSAGDRPLFVYTLGSAGGHPWDEPAPLMTTVIDHGAATRQIATVSRPLSDMRAYPQVLFGGDIVAVIDEGPTEDCATVTLLRVDDGSSVPATADCLPGGPLLGFRAVSLDGRSLAGIGDEDWLDRGGGFETVLPASVIDLATGAVLEEVTIEAERGWHDSGLVSSPGGWIVYGMASTKMSLFHADGSDMARIELPLRRRSDPFFGWGEPNRGFYYRPFELAPGASISAPRDSDPPVDDADDGQAPLRSKPGAQRTDEIAAVRDRSFTARGILLGALVAVLLLTTAVRRRRP